MARDADPMGRVIMRADSLLRPVENAFNMVAALAVLFLMMLGVVQVVMRLRWLFNAPIFGYIDMIELSMPILAVLGISYCQRHGVHIRMDILVQHLRGRWLWLAETLAAILTLAIVLVLTRFSWQFFLDAFLIGDSTVDAELPTWPSKVLVPIAFAILAARLLIQLLGAVRLVVDPAREPLGVVVPLDVAGHAREEIREALGEEGSR